VARQEEQVIAAKPTDDPEAYDVYLLGLAYSLRTGQTPGNVLGAQKYLREAVRFDPKFALSCVLLSYVNARGHLTLTLQPTFALREGARQAAETLLGEPPKRGKAGSLTRGRKKSHECGLGVRGFPQKGRP
jgi:hypothetical protein